MPEERIVLERKGHMAIVTLNRPRRRNAFDREMFLALARVTDVLKKDLPRTIVFTGAENAFCAGFDVNPDNPWTTTFINAVEKADPVPAEKLIRQIRGIVDEFVSLPVPIIAALNGMTYGGGAELAVRCDLRVMDPAVEICFSEVRLGLMPDWGGGAALAHLIGASRAADLILTARKVFAGEAINLGLVNRVSRPEESLEEAMRLAEMISKNGPRAVRSALNLIRGSRNRSFNQSLDYEMDQAVSLIVSGECFHGVGAFLEKKEPQFPDVDFGESET
jgi:enoyl-CoA hydratase/carnithine racemase